MKLGLVGEGGSFKVPHLIIKLVASDATPLIRNIPDYKS